MAEGTRLLPKRALLHLTALYLRPEGSGAKSSLSRCVEYCIEITMHVIALSLSSVRLGVESVIIHVNYCPDRF